ncbi:MAG: T9SS type A sorting domain-containing protein [Bacteroidota bacterium]
MKSFRLVMIVCLFLPLILANNTNAQWVQKGNDINGGNENDESGRAVCISGDGTTVVIGEPQNDSCDAEAGQVKVYKFFNGDWVKKGNTICGDSVWDFYGHSVSINADGSIIAVGAPGYFYNNVRGYARAFRYVGGSWIQMGPDIIGELDGAQAGWSVSLSDDGLTFAVGTPRGDNISGSSDYCGNVRVFHYAVNNWIQLGTDIDGETGNDLSGYSVSLNSDGTSVAIGATNNSGYGLHSGHVRIYDYNGSGWVKRGDDIDGESQGSYSGWSVSLSSDAQIVAIGSPKNYINGTDAGLVRVYTYATGAWEQMGADILNCYAGDMSGTSVSLSDDGLILAVGAPEYNFSGSNTGRASIFEYISGNWELTGNYIIGASSGDYAGMSLSLNADGDLIAIGSPYNNSSYTRSGETRVFFNCSSHSTYGSIDVTECEEYTSPSGIYTWTSSGQYSDIIPNSLGCDSMITINLTINNSFAVINPVACDSFVSPGGNYIWTNTGVYHDTIPNAALCDSIITVNLTIGNTSASLNIEICDSTYTSPSGNYIWSTTGTYLDTIPNSEGCDSLMTINLTIGSDIPDTIDWTICDNDFYISPSGNYVWTVAGTYSDTVSNSAGCDSVYTINLVQLPAPAVDLGNDLTIAENQSVIIGSGYNLPNYLWNTGDTLPVLIIAGTDLGEGTYTYWLYSQNGNGCSAADTITITVTHSIDIEEITPHDGVSIYPNPAKGMIWVQAEGITGIEITDIQGKLMRSSGRLCNCCEIDLGNLPSGVYLVKVLTVKGAVTGKLIVE